MKKTGLITLLLLLVFSVGISSAVEVTCFSGEFVRETGSPVVVNNNFPGVSGTAFLRVYNGAEDDSIEKVSSSIIRVNGVDILTQESFNQNVDYLETEISLEESNTVSVEVRGKPGGKIRVEVVQIYIDSDGGIVEITNQNSPIFGTKVKIPKDAVGEDVFISINYNNELPSANTNNAIPVSKTIKITKSNNSPFNLPITITIPLTPGSLTESDVPVVFYWDTENNKYRTTQVIDIDRVNNKITFITKHLTDFVALLFPSLSENLIPVDTGFTPFEDGFFIHNFGGGKCAGMAVYSNWYYDEKKAQDGNGLYFNYREGIYDEGVNVTKEMAEADDEVAKTIAELTFNQIDHVAINIEQIKEFLRFDYETGLDLITSMIVTEAPQMISFKGYGGIDSIWSHAVSVYKYEDGIFYIYDNNFPNEIVTLFWTPILGFYSYSKESIYEEKLGGTFVYEFVKMPLSSIIDETSLDIIYNWGEDIDIDGVNNTWGVNGPVSDTPCSGIELDNCFDNCPYTQNVDQADSDGDNAGDACDCDPTDPNIYPGANQDIIPPNILSFEIPNSSLIHGDQVVAEYQTSDTNALARVELWRTTDLNGQADDGNWHEITREDLSGLVGTIGTLTDDSPPVGTFWYGLHVVDAACNWGTESSPITVTVSEWALGNILTGEEKAYLTSEELAAINTMSGEELISIGLTNLTSQNINKSKVYFKIADAVYENISSNESDTAKFFFALTRIAALALDVEPDGIDDGLEDIGDVLDDFGVAENGRNYFEGFALTIPELIPFNAPSGIGLQYFLYDMVSLELQGALDDLNGISESFSAIWTEPIGNTVVESDYGDVLFFESAVESAIAAIMIQKAYDLDLDTALVFNDNNLTHQSFLSGNSFFGNLNIVDFHSYLSTGKDYAVSAANNIEMAVNWIQLESDDQSDDFVNLSNATISDVEKFKKTIAAVKLSFDGPSSIDDQETPENTIDDTIVSLHPFFDGIDLRQLLPAFIGDEPVGFLPDTSFGNVLLQLKGESPETLNEDSDGNGTADIFDKVPSYIRVWYNAWDHSVGVYWEKVDGAIAYQIYRSTNYNITKADEKLPVVSGNETFTVDKNIETEQTYYYAVAVITSAGEGHLSTVSSPVSISSPEAPTLVSVEYQDYNALNYIRWTDNNNWNVIEYRVFWGTNYGVTTESEMLTLTDGWIREYAHTGVVGGWTYYYKVQAITPAGASPLSNEMSVYVSFGTNLIPTGLSVTYDGINHRNWISWNSVDNADFYKLYWGTEPGVTKYSEYAGQTPNTEFSHTGVIGDWTYYYRVCSVNTATGEESELSNEMSVYVP